MATRKTTTRSAKAAADETFAQEMAAKVFACKAIVSDEESRKIERIVQSAEHGVGRRIGLATASKDGAWFKSLASDVSHGDAVSMMDGYITLGEHIKRTEELLSWIKAAHVRLMVALAAREDYFSLEEEAAHG